MSNHSNHIDDQAFQDRWDSIQAKLRSERERFSDEDLRSIHGQSHRLVQKFQELYGYNPEDAEGVVGEYLKSVQEGAEDIRADLQEGEHAPQEGANTDPELAQHRQEKKTLGGRLV